MRRSVDDALYEISSIIETILCVCVSRYTDSILYIYYIKWGKCTTIEWDSMPFIPSNQIIHIMFMDRRRSIVASGSEFVENVCVCVCVSMHVWVNSSSAFPLCFRGLLSAVAFMIQRVYVSYNDRIYALHLANCVRRRYPNRHNIYYMFMKPATNKGHTSVQTKTQSGREREEEYEKIKIEYEMTQMKSYTRPPRLTETRRQARSMCCGI